MSCQQNQQKCQVSAKCPPQCPPTCPPQAPRGAPAPCPPPRTSAAPSCCVPTCCVSGFGNSCCLVSYRFPRFYLRRPSSRCEDGSSGCSSCCHSSRGCN